MYVVKFGRLKLCDYIKDIDECSLDNECDTNANCNNTIGSYYCTCDVGYSGNGRNCDGLCLKWILLPVQPFENMLFIQLNLDINECIDGSNDCHGNADCINTAGSYSCMCQVGFSGNGTFCEGRDYDL